MGKSQVFLTSVLLSAAHLPLLFSMRYRHL
jgi:hypothetical protein